MSAILHLIASAARDARTNGDEPAFVNLMAVLWNLAPETAREIRAEGGDIV